MSWRTQYQPGSFRGAPFRTAGHERSGGRRMALHEFPGRDEPVVEDLGRRYRQFSIECHVIGADYMTGRDALLDALEAAGPGLLVHPWHGAMMVAVQDFTTSESTEEGGVCWFKIEFVEAGLPAPAPVALASGEAAADAAAVAKLDATTAFATRFTVQGAAGFVEQAAADLVHGMAQVAELAAGLRGGSGPALRAFDAGLRLLPDDLAAQLRAPINLGRAISGLVVAVGALGGAGGRRRRMAPLELMLDWAPATAELPESTPQRQREARNRQALLDLFRTACTAELVRAAAVSDFASLDDARALRDTIATRIDALALAAADRGDDAVAARYEGLRLALVRDIEARGATLARLYRITQLTTEPALVIAHRYQGDVRSRPGGTGLVAAAEQLVARNRIIHPGFVAAGMLLEVPSEYRPGSHARAGAGA